ncbi:MAG: type IV pili methyl-accepting chemotaxis transducer N-terminal domain-containing protein [Betaproteobacteria bacterium]
MQISALFPVFLANIRQHAIVLAAAVFLIGGAGNIALAQPKAAAKLDPTAALNKAARQPMLAERITKTFTQIGQRVLEARSKRQLDEAVKEFESALKELQAAAPTAEIKENYQLLEQLFEEYKSIIGKPVTLASAKQLAEQNEELVWISTKGAMLMAAHSKSARSDLITTAGEVRTLTQRIAKLYLFRSWGIRSDVIANDLKKAETDYRADVAKLQAATHNTEQIKSELALAETQYIFLKQAIDRLNANKTSTVELEHVAKACDNILEVMERVTKLYEGIKA